MKKYLHVLVIFSSIVIPSGSQDVPALHTPLDQFIHEAGNKWDVYFTIEGASDGTIYSEMLLLEVVTAHSVPTNLDSAISALTNSVTNLTVMADTDNQHIYHLVDKRLLGLEDYAMNRILQSMKFDGDAWSFVNHIKEGIPNVLNQNVFGSRVTGVNQGTSISINSAKVSVRDALSNGVDLRGYSRVIWTGFTPLETHQTTIHFLGTTNFIPHG